MVIILSASRLAVDTRSSKLIEERIAPPPWSICIFFCMASESCIFFCFISSRCCRLSDVASLSTKDEREARLRLLPIELFDRAVPGEPVTDGIL